MPRCTSPVDPCQGRVCVIAPADAPPGMTHGKMSRSRTRRRRCLETVARETDFLDQVRRAWTAGAEMAEAEDARNGNCSWEASDEMDAATTFPNSCTEDASPSASFMFGSVPSFGGGVAAPAAPSVPREILESVKACSCGRPPVVAGLRLQEFWDHLERFGKKENAGAILQRMLNFRSKYKWPLTITLADIGSTLMNGPFQYLPPTASDSRPFLVVTPRQMDMAKCPLEQHQKLLMLILEAAFRASAMYADGGAGLLAVVDLRGTSSSVARNMLASFSDLARSVAMCKGSLPTSISHLHIIEGDNPSSVHKAIVSLLLSNLNAKVQARVSFGNHQAVLEAVGAGMMPKSLGGRRDGDAEWRQWLQGWQAEEVALGLALTPSADRARLV